jgi:hypothetical protein
VDTNGNESSTTVIVTINSARIALTFPSNYYTYIKQDNENGIIRYETDKLAISSDKKFFWNEYVLKNGKFVFDTDENETEYKFVNGNWVEDDASMSVVFSQNNRVAILDDYYKVTIKSKNSIEGQKLTIENSNKKITMPSGAELTILNFEVIKDRYSIDSKVETHENTENDYYLSLAEIIQYQCGTHYMTHAKDGSGIIGISFTCGEQNQTSGTLVGVKSDETLVNNVGTWEISKIENSDIDAIFLNIDRKYKEEEDIDDKLFSMKDEVVWDGWIDRVGNISLINAYNQIVADAVAYELSKQLVKKTGQTKSYDQNGTEVTNGSIKDDGYYQKGITPSYTRDASKKIVTDNIRGLMWQDDENVGSIQKKWVTQVNYDAGDYNNTAGDTATTYCNELTLGGFNDWRLPTRKELVGIIDYGKLDPTISDVFTAQDSVEYWSSTSPIIYNNRARIVNFYDGGEYYYDKNNNRYIRCVRNK